MTYLQVTTATFAYDHPVTPGELSDIAAGNLSAPAQATLATGAIVEQMGDPVGPVTPIRVLAGDEYEAVSDPGVLLSTPTDADHTNYVESRYLSPSGGPSGAGQGSGGAVPTGADPFGLGSLSLGATGGASAAAPGGEDLITLILVGVIVGAIVKYL